MATGTASKMQCLQNLDDPLELQKGKTFPTYNDWSDFLKKYQTQEKQIFVVKSSTTFNNRRIQMLKVKCNPELKYYEIRYICKFGGSHATAAKGMRNVCSSKMGCDAFIKIILTEDKKQLQIKDFKATHVGHEGSEAFFELLPQNKKLSNEEEAEVINLLQLRCDKKFLQDKIHQDFKKPWSRKDISNLVTKYKDDDDADSLVKAVQLLRQTYKADVSVLHEDNEFKGLYFSTTEMREAMSLWPEIVFIDGTYKLLRRGLTLMLLLVEDSVGLSKVVGAALLAREDRATFAWFLQCFKKENLIPCSKMQCMMGDKDLLERDLLKEVFPNIPIYICLFHVLRTFGREVSREKMNITKEQREISLRFLDSLAKSSSQTKYDKLYGEFSQSAPTPVIHYFNKNWHPIRDEWTRYSMVHGNLGNQTNNRLESVNSKIKQVVKKNSTLAGFVHSFFKWLQNRNRQMVNDVAKNFLKKQVTVYDDNSIEHQYMTLLTNYAFSVVIKEITQHTLITLRDHKKSTKECSVFSNNNFLKVKPTECECATWKSMLLPCRHILAVRNFFGMPLFAKELCAERWMKQYISPCESTRLIASIDEEREISRPVSITKCMTKKKLTDAQKKKLLTSAINDMTQVALLSSQDNFNYRLHVLNQISNYWREGFEVCIEKLETKVDSQANRSDNCDTSDNVLHLPDPDLKINMENIRSLRESNIPVITEGSMGMHDNSVSVDVENLEQNMFELTVNSTEYLPSVANLTDMVMPSPLKLKNRYKRAEMTTVEIPKRRKGPVSFTTLSDEDKAYQILSWITPDESMPSRALSGEYQLKPEDVETRPEMIPDSLGADDVSLEIVQPYLEKEAFRSLCGAVRSKKNMNIWTCRTCGSEAEEDCALCESCLAWYHFKCVGFKLTKKNQRSAWFCPTCKIVK